MWSHGQPADQAVALIDLVDVGSETSSRCGFGNQENFKVFEYLTVTDGLSTSLPPGFVGDLIIRSYT